MNADPGQQLWLLGIVFLSLVLIMLFSCAECVLNVLGKQQLESLADKQEGTSIDVSKRCDTVFA
jgi:hypothetical protein